MLLGSRHDHISRSVVLDEVDVKHVNAINVSDSTYAILRSDALICVTAFVNYD